MPRGLVILLAVGACTLAPATGQLPGGAWSLEREHAGAGVGAETGSTVAAVGDWDGDGVPDYAVGSPGGSSGMSVGHIEVFSGASGALLRRYPQSGERRTLGLALLGGEDLDGDGVADLVGARTTDLVSVSGATGQQIATTSASLGGRTVLDWVGDLDGDGVRDFASGDPLSTWNGRVRIHSGATLAVLHVIMPPPGFVLGEFGYAFAGVGDVDGDGVPDLAATISNNDYGGTGQLLLYAGANGALMQQIFLPTYGVWMDEAGDVDGDGYDDFLFGMPSWYVPGYPGRGYVRLYRGGPHGVMEGWTTYSWTSGQRLGAGLRRVTDFDGDGVRDFAAGCPDGSYGGLLSVHSTADGSLLHAFSGPSFEAFGYAIDGLGDVDADGIEDLLVGAPDSDVGGLRAGRAYLLRLDPWLVPDSPALSASPGASVELGIDFPASEAGLGYVVLATTEGVGANSVRGITLPLASSPLLQAMLGGFQPAPLGGGVGTLDAQGRALATLDGGPLLAAQVGRTLWLCAVSFTRAPLTPSLVSAPRWIRIVP